MSRKKATYADLVAVPEFLVAEIIGGELYTSPRPASPHALAASAIGSVLFDRFNGPRDGREAPGGWWILDEPELHFGDDVLVPDVAGWRRERMPKLPKNAAFTLPPDWVCEVISPSTGRLDRVRKMPVYAREQVRHMWIVDPVLRTVEAFAWTAEGWILTAAHGDQDIARVEPFPEIELDVTRWWIDDA